MPPNSKNEARLTCETVTRPVPIVGFSWEPNTTSANAKQIANENWPKLAHFIFDYKNTCKHQHNKDVNVRLVAHSLGARVGTEHIRRPK